MTPMEFNLLVALHRDNRWDSDLTLCFGYVFDRILTPIEREITKLKIEGLTDKEVCKVRKCKAATIQRAIYRIKYKFRNGIGERIEDTLRKKIWLANKDKKGRYYEKPVEAKKV
jgi:DNA-binding CsgD family transcriptional regulator